MEKRRKQEDAAGQTVETRRETRERGYRSGGGRIVTRHVRNGRAPHQRGCQRRGNLTNVKTIVSR